MNLFPLSRNGGGLVIAGSDGPVLAPPVAELALGGIRPEALRLAESGIAARVLDAEYLGADTVLACAVGEARLLARLAGRVMLPPGTTVYLASDESLHLFNATNGRRIDAAAITEIVAA
jgi:sn-glycerol 3-phosphate transport system ATP-binding protein